MKLRSLFLVLIIGFFCRPFVGCGQEDVRSFERMALSGDVKAQTVMGLRCTDLVKSYAWLSVASMRGEKSAFEIRSIVQKNMHQQIDMSLQIKKGECPSPSLLLRSNEMYQKQINEGEQLAKKLDQEIRGNQIAVLQKARQEKFVIGGDSQAPDLQKALNGDAKSQTLIGNWFSDGVQGYAWLSLAADQGEETAVKPLSIYQKNLSPKQIEEAKKLAQKIDQEIKRNQLMTLPKEEVERVLAEEIGKRVEQEKEAARALAERAREVERQTALQKAEQAKEATRALAERAKEIEKQEQAAALQREEQAAIQRQQMEIQQQKERKAAQGLLVAKILAVCVALYAIYLGRRQCWTVCRVIGELYEGMKAGWKEGFDKVKMPDGIGREGAENSEDLTKATAETARDKVAMVNPSDGQAPISVDRKKVEDRKVEKKGCGCLIVVALVILGLIGNCTKEKETDADIDPNIRLQRSIMNKFWSDFDRKNPGVLESAGTSAKELSQ